MIGRILPYLAALASVLSACAHYTGTSRALRPDIAQRESGWLWVSGVPFVHQRSKADCGAAALAMVLQHWGSHREVALLGAPSAPAGYSARELRDHARALGFSAYVVEGTLRDLRDELVQQRPALVGTAKPTNRGTLAHYEVVVGMHLASQRVATLDPSLGWRENSLQGFLKEWVPARQVLLVVLGPSR